MFRFADGFVLLVLMAEIPASSYRNCPSSPVMEFSMLSDHLWNQLVFILLPLIVLSVIAALLHRVGLNQKASAPNSDIERSER